MIVHHSIIILMHPSTLKYYIKQSLNDCNINVQGFFWMWMKGRRGILQYFCSFPPRVFLRFRVHKIQTNWWVGRWKRPLNSKQRTDHKRSCRSGSKARLITHSSLYHAIEGKVTILRENTQAKEEVESGWCSQWCKRREPRYRCKSWLRLLGNTVG